MFRGNDMKRITIIIVLSLLFVSIFSAGCTAKKESTQTTESASIQTEKEAVATTENISSDLEDVNREVNDIGKILENE